MAYDSKAQEFVYSFYAKGWSKERSLPEIRKVYAGFSGSTWDSWEAALSWKERRALADAKLRNFDDLCRDTEPALLLELNEIRLKLFEAIRAGQVDTQTVYAYTSVSKQCADISRNSMASRDPGKVQIQILSQAVQDLVVELMGTDAIAKVLERNSDAVGRAVKAVTEKYTVAQE